MFGEWSTSASANLRKISVVGCLDQGSSGWRLIMGNYLYMNGSVPITFDSDTAPSLDENPRGMHLIKIAAAFEDAGIDGVRVKCVKERGDRFFVMLQSKQDSLAERVLNTIAEKGEKTNHYPTVEAALAIAKYVQEMEGNSHD